MARVIAARLDATSHRYAIVVSRFNEFITGKLLSGAIDALVRHGASESDITQVWTPGAWELPLAAQKLAAAGGVDGVIALGCVIRGATPHFDYIAAEVAKGLAQASMSTGVPISFGVLTTDSIEQAVERAGSKAGNKGADAALAAIEMVNLLRTLSSDAAR